MTDDDMLLIIATLFSPFKYNPFSITTLRNSQLSTTYDVDEFHWMIPSDERKLNSKPTVYYG